MNMMIIAVPLVYFFTFLLTHYISVFKHVKFNTLYQSARILNSLPSFCQILNNFHSLEVVDRVRETQLEVGDNFNF